MAASFNLLDKPWIPVIRTNGKTEKVGIVDALANAGRIREIAASNPMDRVAILRFLLALLYWCKGNPPDAAIPGNSFPEECFTKLNENKECFDLLGDGKRFYQCTPRAGESKLSANYLIQEVPTGTNFWHFRHSTDKTDGLCCACCAMGLLRLPLFATSGGRGKPPGINSKPPIYVIPLGSSLADTLRLSWRKISDSELGTPAWKKPQLELPKKGQVFLLMGLTWLPRRVWLDDPEEPEDNCISCGRKEALIRQCVFAGIGSTRTEGDGPGRDWIDPHIIHDGDDVVKPSNALDGSDAAAGDWARIMAGILEGQKATGKVWVVGFATVKNDKYLEAMEYEIPIRCARDAQKVQENIEKIKMWQKESLNLSNLVRKVTLPNVTPKESSRKHIEIRPMVDSIRPHVEGRVLAKIGELLAGGVEAWEQAASEYSPMMTAIAKSLSPGYTTEAVQRRKQITGLLPNMGPRQESAKTAGRKKGGTK